ncbi:hypothetical protein FGG08_004732 [Glutinoglossum americanum]|uniref:HNH nuclease domain-containing protein n=1 Tax=Glutinoglossum americanum TaxID=1670608 RepID=A0A9P8I545_9PEZI|nr:hypothetical protein FGG08_004732 [Glutinoglossum americanum]
MEASQIPDRSASLPNRNERRLNVQASRGELKRKLSNSSLEKDSKRYIELRIDDIELEREELALDRDEMGWEIEHKMMEDRECRAARRTINRRIVSLGDDLWQLKRKLRAIDEKDGKVALLTPDSEGAFTSALLHLYKDPNTSRKRSSAMQKEMRRSTIEAYDATRPTVDDSPDKDWLRCQVTGEFFPPDSVKAAHIVPASLGTELATYIFGEEKGTRLFSVDNCLILHSQIEKAFDNGNFVILPVDPAVTPIRRWKVAIVNDSSRNQGLVMKSADILGDLDGKELAFRTQQRPAARFLYYHFVISLLHCRQYNQPGWETTWTKLKTSQPWPTPGPYLRQSMLMTLAKAVGNVSEADIEKLVENHTFDGQGRLAEDEEQEIARRIEEGHEELVRTHERGDLGWSGDGDEEEDEA